MFCRPTDLAIDFTGERKPLVETARTSEECSGVFAIQKRGLEAIEALISQQMG